MDKYYTPEIEEVHVGFIFEQTTGYKFVTRIYAEDLGGLYSMRNAIDQSQVRVKYLDREDIESLGWIHTGGTMDAARSLQHFRNGNIMELILYRGTKVRIHNTRNEIFFLGTIKNKSELSRILKQIGI